MSLLFDKIFPKHDTAFRIFKRTIYPIYTTFFRPDERQDKKVLYEIQFGLKLELDLNSLHDVLLSKILDKGNYEPEVVKFIINHLTNNDIFVDGGANNGYFSLIASLLCLKVYAYEPSISYDRLIKNIHLNHLENIEPINMALWSDKETLKLFHYKKDDGRDSIILENGKDEKDFTLVNTTPLPNIHIKILKLDLEGAETKVLETANPDKIDYLIVEYAPMLFNDFDNKFNALKKFGKIFRLSDFKVINKRQELSVINTNLLIIPWTSYKANKNDFI